MSSSRTESTPDGDFAALWGQKRVQLESLASVYERILSLTAADNADQLVSTMRDADRITNEIRAIDARLRSASLPVMPAKISDAEDRLVNKIHRLNQRITEIVQEQSVKVRDQLNQVRVLRKAVRHYRPYEKAGGTRVNWSG